MSDEIIEGASGQKYRAFKIPKPIGYWEALGGVIKLPADEKPTLWRRLTHKVMLGWTWHDGLDGL